jgi:hypothetical protein
LSHLSRAKRNVSNYPTSFVTNKRIEDTQIPTPVRFHIFIDRCAKTELLFEYVDP